MQDFVSNSPILHHGKLTTEMQNGVAIIRRTIGGRKVSGFGGDYADNTAVPVFKEVEVAAVIPAATPDGWDEMSAVTGRVFVAQNPEQFTYDADGNMTSDGRFRYTWNGENRLVRAQELCAPTNRNPYTLTYAYDHKGRMVSKRITENDGHDTLVKSIAYVWDGWNIIREIQWPVASGQWPVVTDNVWGLDLDGTLQGAGGVGGLLAVQRSDCATTNSAFCILHSALYLPTYDANGNISEYVSTNGEIVAHYDYSPFGETLIESGDLASTFTHRFSTKPWCPVTGLCEYQMRKYRPEMGRWMSRDPMGVDKGVNELSFLGNNSIGLSDYLGLKPSDGGRRKTKPCECGDDELNKVALLAIDAGIKDMKAKNDGLERCGRLCCRKETGEIKFTKRVGNTNTEENREQCPPDLSPVCAIFGKEYMLVGYYHTHPASPNFGDNDRDWIKAKNVPFFVGIGDGKGKRLDPADKINPHVTVPPRVPAEPIETIIPWPNDKERK